MALHKFEEPVFSMVCAVDTSGEYAIRGIFTLESDASDYEEALALNQFIHEGSILTQRIPMRMILSQLVGERFAGIVPNTVTESITVVLKKT